MTNPTTGFKQHPLRERLHNEVHARPPNALVPPVEICHLAFLSARDNSSIELRHLQRLAASFGVAGPQEGTNHFAADLGPLRVNFERHTEFSRYTFIAKSDGSPPFQTPVLDLLPAGWLAETAGEVIAAIDVALVQGDLPENLDTISETYFDGETVIASMVGSGAGAAFTDFRLRGNGRSRILIHDLAMTPRQAGRITQRLLEIETYRMMALLALPQAQALRPFLEESERTLAKLTSSMEHGDHDEDPRLLEQLTALEVAVQGRLADSQYRLSAAAAYYDIVERRIVELREQRLTGFQTFREFVERRLVPAMSTCVSVSASGQQLSERIARATNLLSTRVEVSREAQNRALLASVARRAKLQLRLQQTVEGLSVAAITYYIVGLVGYFAKALASAGLAISPDLLTGLSVPVVLFLVAFGITRIRNWLSRGS